jgi:hypothetical protein
MFQSYKFIKLLDIKDGKTIWEYELIDSEFGAISVIGTGLWFEVELGATVIQEYKKRNLNVAANLAMAFICYNKQYPDWSIQFMINLNKNHNPFFQQYEEDLQKYLVLL